MLGPDEVLPERAGLVGGTLQDGLGAFGEPIERRCRHGEALVGGLLADAQGSADLGPGPSAQTAPVDEVAKQRVADLFQVGDRPRRLRELVENVVTRGIGSYCFDQFLEVR